MKKIILLISALYLLIITSAFFINTFCHSEVCRIRDDNFIGIFLWVFMPLLPAFFLSLSTYWLREEAFKAWWSFARWWVFVIAGVTYYFSQQPTNDPLNFARDFYAMIIGSTYFILILVSAIRIVRVYWKKKSEI
jgi:hypothetical protein